MGIYDADEVMIFAGMIADQCMRGFNVAGFTEDDLDAIRNAAAEAAETVIASWTEEPPDGAKLSLRLVVEMESTASKALVIRALDILFKKDMEAIKAKNWTNFSNGDAYERDHDLLAPVADEVWEVQGKEIKNLFY